MLKETLKTLCALNGPSGGEEEVRAYLKKRLAPHVDSMRVDGLGNLICVKKGGVSAEGKLMICAHMDEVGLMVRHITKEGFLKFDAVGGIDRRVLLGKQVLVGPNRIPGVVGLQAIHLTTKEERKKVARLGEFYIDIGASSGEEAEKMVSLGDYAVFLPETLEFGHDRLKAKAIDDRVGCAVMVELMERELPVDVTFVFTVQEEVGTRGAFGAAFSVKPEIALVLEGTTAADLPTVGETKRVCYVGRGPVLSMVDGGAIYDRALFETLRDLAEEHHIPWQVKEMIAGGTDARAVQRSREGVRVCGISAAVRYLHAPTSVASLTDCEHILTLAELFLEKQAREMEGVK